jgi:hypothetical protein
VQVRAIFLQKCVSLVRGGHVCKSQIVCQHVIRLFFLDS